MSELSTACASTVCLSNIFKIVFVLVTFVYVALVMALSDIVCLATVRPGFTVWLLFVLSLFTYYPFVLV